jgi:hypothetical protein
MKDNVLYQLQLNVIGRSDKNGRNHKWFVPICRINWPLLEITNVCLDKTLSDRLFNANLDPT